MTTAPKYMRKHSVGPRIREGTLHDILRGASAHRLDPIVDREINEPHAPRRLFGKSRSTCNVCKATSDSRFANGILSLPSDDARRGREQKSEMVAGNTLKSFSGSSILEFRRKYEG